MPAKTIIENGFDGIVAEVECHISNGLPMILIVGFANKAVDEAKERIRSAFASCNIPFPKKRLIINLAPADVPKEHTSFDLAIAVSILSAQTKDPLLPKATALFGELSLDGSLRPVRGILGKLISAKKHGIKTIFIPKSNASQAALIDGLDIYAFSNLNEVYLHLSRASQQPPITASSLSETEPHFENDFSEIIGQTQAKRALEIAATGAHNVLLSGPPGTGKSMLAKALNSILPPMTKQEIIESSHLHSLASKNYEELLTFRPFRAPHHSASDTAIIGGGRNPRPGEISLAHNGVLYFDEFPEFKKNAIEALRQPLEEHAITVSRAKDTIVFPANFILIATANPCPCGYYGTEKPCTCMPRDLYRYQRKLSGPILDRIDIYVDVQNLDHTKLLAKTPGSTSATSQEIRARVIKARKRQYERFKSSKTNAHMTNHDLKKYSNISFEAKKLLDAGATKLELSPRAYMRTLKVACTIADLSGEDHILPVHVAEALQFRPKRQYN